MFKPRQKKKNQMILEFLASGGSCVENERRFIISDSPNHTGKDSDFWFPKNTAKVSEFLIHQTTQERIQSFWSLKEHNEGFRTSDLPNNTEENSEFLIPQRTQGRVQNLIPKEQWKGFSISDPLKEHRRRLRISEPLNDSRQDSELLSPLRTLERIQKFWSPPHWTGFPTSYPQRGYVLRGIRISDHPNNLRGKTIFLSGLKAVTKFEVKVDTKGFWSKLKTD